MNISRRGHGADHGSRSVELNEPRFDWDKETKSVKATVWGVGDFATNATHDYVTRTPLPELGQMLDVLSTEALEQDPAAIAVALGPHLRSLIRIASVCIWPANRLPDPQG